MSDLDMVRRYPLLAALLIASSGDMNAVKWAGSVLSSARDRKTAFSQGLIREVYRKRRVLRNKDAKYAVGLVIGVGESKATFEPTKDVA